MESRYYKEIMKETIVEKLPILAILCTFLLIQILSILMVPTFQETDIRAFEDPESFYNPIYFIVMIIAFTLLILLLAKYKVNILIRIIIVFAVFSTLVLGFSAFIPEIPKISSMISSTAFSIIPSALLIFALLKYPRWYIMDAVGIILATTVSTIFGISLGIIPVMILLFLLAIYDFISVYKTKHMLTLADDVIDLKLPVLLVIPKKRTFSLEELDQVRSEGGKERDAYIVGLGDMIIPTVLVVSSHIYIGPMTTIGAMIGGMSGLLLLMKNVEKGKAQAGLPFLNGGAIIGFLIAYLIGMII
jgi:presenilin-like A22 family membrane protease